MRSSRTAEAPEKPALDGRRVLVVEDEYFIADDMAVALAREGAVVLGPVPTCAEALALVESERGQIDMAVLDINLGGELCFPVGDALIEAGVPFIFATGYEETMVPERFRHVRRWEKPFNLSGLVHGLQTTGWLSAA